MSCIRHLSAYESFAGGSNPKRQGRRGHCPRPPLPISRSERTCYWGLTPRDDAVEPAARLAASGCLGAPAPRAAATPRQRRQNRLAPRQRGCVADSRQGRQKGGATTGRIRRTEAKRGPTTIWWSTSGHPAGHAQHRGQRERRHRAGTLGRCHPPAQAARGRPAGRVDGPVNCTRTWVTRPAATARPPPPGYCPADRPPRQRVARAARALPLGGGARLRLAYSPWPSE